MLAKTALPALMLMAQSAGVDVERLTAPKTGLIQSVASSEQAKPILKLSFREISAQQSRAIETRSYGNARLNFSLAFSPEEPWVKLAQDDEAAQAWTFSSLETGVTASLPSGLWKVRTDGGFVQLHDLFNQPDVPRVRVNLARMIRDHYTRALHIQFAGLVEYAVFYEDGSPVPLSVSLLREDAQGRLWITDGRYERIKEIHWFLAINGVLYGMRREGLLLVFYAKPVPPGAKAGISAPYERELKSGI